MLVVGSGALDTAATLAGLDLPWCNGEIRALAINQDGTAGAEVAFSTISSGITSFGEDRNGELFVTNIFTRKLYALIQN